MSHPLGDVPPPNMSGVPADIAAAMQQPAPVVPQPAPQPVPVPQPVPQPVTPPAVTPEPTNIVVNEPVKGATGNALLDTAIESFSITTNCSEDDINKAIGAAIESGDVSKIDKAFIAARFGVHAGLATQLAEQAVAEQAREVEATKQTAYTVAGGEANWKSAVALFNSRANAATRLAAATMADAGNIKEGAELVMSTLQHLGLVPNGTFQGVQGGQSTGETPISQAEFRTELMKLVNSGKSLDNSLEYRALLARPRAK